MSFDLQGEAMGWRLAGMALKVLVFLFNRYTLLRVAVIWWAWRIGRFLAEILYLDFGLYRHLWIVWPAAIFSVVALLFMIVDGYVRPRNGWAGTVLGLLFQPVWSNHHHWRIFLLTISVGASAPLVNPEWRHTYRAVAEARDLDLAHDALVDSKVRETIHSMLLEQAIRTGHGDAPHHRTMVEKYRHLQGSIAHSLPRIKEGIPFDNSDISLNQFARREYWKKVNVTLDEKLVTTDGSRLEDHVNIPLEYKAHLKASLAYWPQLAR